MTTKPSLRDLRRNLLIGASLGAMLTFGDVGAFAQDTTGEDAEEDTRRLGTVEVTATRRDGVTVQDVPIAITAFDADLLLQSDFNRLNDLEQLSPSVQITQGQSASAGTSISIRGIGTGADNFGFEPAVGVFVDGVFRTRTGSGIQELPELAGVEVLRGPQGTLFGRNTSAGVVNIRTAKPTFEPTAYASVSAGNFDSVEVNAGVSGQLFENWAGRIDGKFRRRDGFVNDLNADREFNNIDRFSVRGQLLFEDANRSLRLIVDYTETDEECCGVVIGQVGAFGPIVNGVAATNGLIGNVDPATLVGDARFNTAASPTRSFSDDVQDFGVSAEYNHDFSFGKFTSISALREFESTRSQDIDFSGIDRAFRDGQENDDRVFTQEFRLQGDAGPLDWLVGAYYINERIETFDNIQFGVDADVFSDASFGFSSLGAVGTPLSLFGTGIVPGAVPFLFTDTLGLTPGGDAGGIVPFAIVEAVTEGAVAAALPDLTAALTAGLIDQATFDAQLGALTGNFVPFFLPPTAAGSGAFDSFEQNTNSFAIFTHNEFAVTDRLTLTGGIRYTYERKDIEASLNSTVAQCAALSDPSLVGGFLNGVDVAVASAPDPASAAAAAGLPAFLSIGSLISCNPAVNSEFDVLDGETESRTENAVTGTFKISYDLTPDILLFAGYSRGFKSGGFNLDRSSLESLFASTFLGAPNDGPQLDDLEFEDETVNSYEAGFKSSWYDGRLTVNATGFFQDVQDFQENTFLGTNFVVFNNDVESFGVEVDVGAQPIDGLTLQGGFIYVNATRLPPAMNFGQQLGNTPEFVLTGQGTYIVPINDLFQASFHANVRWQSATNLIQGDLFTSFDNGAFATVGARAGLQTTDGKYAIEAFATNLFDQDFFVTAFGVPEQAVIGAPPGDTDTLAAFPGEPRFWGVEARVRF